MLQLNFCVWTLDAAQLHVFCVRSCGGWGGGRRRRHQCGTFCAVPVYTSLPKTVHCWCNVSKRTRTITVLSVPALEAQLVVSHVCGVSVSEPQRGVHGGRPTHQQLSDDRAALLPGTPAQELRLRLWLLYSQQPQHMWTHLWVSTASGRPQWVLI